MKKLLLILILLAGSARAATFGDSTGSYSGIDCTARLHSVLATMPESGTLTHIKVFLENTGHYNDYYFNFFIMTSDTVLVDSTATYHYTSTMTSGWVTLPVVAGASLTARNYYIGFKHVQGSSGGPDDSLHVMRGSNAGSALARRDWIAYPALGQKNGSGWTALADYRYQILAVYTTGGTCTNPDIDSVGWYTYIGDTTSNPTRLVAGIFWDGADYDSVQWFYSADTTDAISDATYHQDTPLATSPRTDTITGLPSNSWIKIFARSWNNLTGDTCSTVSHTYGHTGYVAPATKRFAARKVPTS